MSKQRAEQLIVISLVVMLASTVGGGLAQGKTGEKYYGKKIVGGFLTMFFSAIAAEVAPEAAALLAVSMATYAFLHYGLPAINGHYKAATKPNLHNPRERLPATPGPVVTPEPLKETLI